VMRNATPIHRSPPFEEEASAIQRCFNSRTDLLTYASLNRNDELKSTHESFSRSSYPHPSGFICEDVANIS
jgi:hypothetical protein